MTPPQTHTPHSVETTLQHTAHTHLTLPHSEICSVMGPTLSGVRAAVTAQGLAPSDAC